MVDDIKILKAWEVSYTMCELLEHSRSSVAAVHVYSGNSPIDIQHCLYYDHGDADSLAWERRIGEHHRGLDRINVVIGTMVRLQKACDRPAPGIKSLAAVEGNPLNGETYRPWTSVSTAEDLTECFLLHYWDPTVGSVVYGQDFTLTADEVQLSFTTRLLASRVVLAPDLPGSTLIEMLLTP